MKLLFFTDTHIRHDNFQIRKDNYQESLKRKLEEVVEIGRQEKVDYFLHGGDFFDRPDATAKITGEFGEIFQGFPKPILGIIGNHDIYGYNTETLDRSMLGIYERLGLVRLVFWNQPLILEEEGRRIQISGAPYEYDIDRGERKYYYPKREDEVDYHLLLIHSFLTDKPFLDTIDHTVIDQVVDTDCDLVLSGHYHTGYDLIEREGTIFANPGALIRNSRAKSEFNRIPQVALIEIGDKIQVHYRPLKSARPGSEVLVPMDRRSQVSKRKEEELKLSFRQAADQEQLNIENILKEMAQKESVDQEIIDEALRRLKDALS